MNLTRDFLIESQEGLDRMERCLTDLEERPHDTGLLAEIFRSVHTIKGTTGFLGFKRLEKLAHAGENLLGMLREGKLTADAEKITALLQLLDGLRSILRSIEADGSEGEDDDALLICRLEDLQAPALANARLEACLKAGMEPTPCQSSESAIESEPRAPVQPSAPVNLSSAAQSVEPLRTGPSAGKEPKEADAGQGHPRAQAGAATDRRWRVDVTLLNRMMNLVGEYADPQSGLAGHPVRSQHDRAFPPPRHGDRRPPRIGDESSHAARLEYLFEDAAHGARPFSTVGPPCAAAGRGPGH